MFATLQYGILIFSVFAIFIIEELLGIRPGEFILIDSAHTPELRLQYISLADIYASQRDNRQNNVFAKTRKRYTLVRG